ANGLEDAISRGLKDIALSGDTALVATRWGVERSTDGGFNFPAAFPVLWESSAGYEISAVWTDGTACAAAGSGGSMAQGIWYSATGEADTWDQVLDVSGQSWLHGSDDGTIVSGNLFSGAISNGYMSSDGGSSWETLPFNWEGVSGSYQRPFVSDSRILSRRVYEEFDPESGQFIVFTDGPYLYDTATGVGNDMDGSLFTEAELRNQAIVEADQPYLLIAERDGAVYWFQVSSGWPASDFDFTPPLIPRIDVSPRVTTSPGGTVSIEPFAFEAEYMFISKFTSTVNATYDVNGFHTFTNVGYGPITGGWVPYSTNLSLDLDEGPSLHGIGAWYADGAGNQTDPAVLSGTTVFPDTLVLGSGQTWVTWLYANAGESFTIGGTAPGGDLDIHHWEPGSQFSNNWAATFDNDTLAFTVARTGFHVVALLNWPGSTVFDGTITAQVGRASPLQSQRNDKPAEGIDVGAFPGSPPPFWSADAVFEDAFEATLR
ncbi:MAG: hypothetical protein V2J10_03545, partial [Wenzhouxiangella sp.]|nr:hypothetical protein [Wenzhouxiangella sp.]